MLNFTMNCGAIAPVTAAAATASEALALQTFIRIVTLSKAKGLCRGLFLNDRDASLRSA
jgi:hypothetical protein